MACRGISEGHAILDCGHCGGSGYNMVLYDNLLPKKETCKTCEGTCLVRIPLKKIPILDYTPEVV